jgi:hypothetical protein
VLRDPVDRTISAFWHDKRAGRLPASLREAVETQPFYTEVSRYSEQIAPFLAHFPRDRFLFIDFAELSANPAGVAKRCMAFACCDPSAIDLRLDEPKNASFQFNGAGRLFFRLFRDERAASRFVGAVKRATPAIIHRLAKSAMTSPTDGIAAADRAWLADMFTMDNQRMEALAGFRFYR